MQPPFSPSPRRSGQLGAASGRGELPFWAVLVVSCGVLVLGLRSGDGAQPNGDASTTDATWLASTELRPLVPEGEGLGQSSEADPHGPLVHVQGYGPDGGGVGPGSGRTEGDSSVAQLASHLVESHPSAVEWSGLEAPWKHDRLPVHGLWPADSVPTTAERPGLSAEGVFRQGIRHGEWKTYRDDGSLQSKGVFAMGLRTGVWEAYDPQGVVLSEMNYLAGSRHGDWRAYSNDGALIGEGQYADNTPSGRWTTYYSGGQVKERGLFVNGLREGPWEFYDDLGLPTLQAGVYRAGIKVQ